MDFYSLLEESKGFQWDSGNILKNWEKHGVTALECEQVFFNLPLVAAADLNHSRTEPRNFVLGQTDSARLLFLVFTVRDRRIRVISARNMNRKERRICEAS